MIVATAGHVDHGKTSLVKALTGVDTDRLPEEKRRGLTIDLGFAYLHLDTGPVIGFVDVPGHERFIRNMLAGVAGIDFALLVIAADDGVMPQTREHLAILDLLGVSTGAVALTKIDRVPPERVAEVIAEASALVALTQFAGTLVFPVSVVNGAGMDALKRHLESAARQLPAKSSEGNFRLSIDRCLNITGAGLVVTGCVMSGEIAEGDQVRVLLAGTDARVRSIHAVNVPAKTGRAGQRCALNLAGVAKRAAIARGDWVVTGGIARPVRTLDARLRVLRCETRALAHWTPVHVHLGAADVTGRAALLENSEIPPGGSGLVQIVLDYPIGALWGDRFIVRDQSSRRTLGGGIVIDVFPPPRGRARPDRLAYLQTMELNDHGKTLSALLAGAASGVDLASFAVNRNLTTAMADLVYFHVPMARAGDWGFSPAHWRALRRKALTSLEAWHLSFPDSGGPAEDRILHDVDSRVPREAVKTLAGELLNEGLIVREGASVRLAGYRMQISRADASLWVKVRPLLERCDLRPPTIAELAAALGEDFRNVDSALSRLEHHGLVARVSKNRFFLPETLRRLKIIAEEEAHVRGAITAAAFRDRSRIGRNLAIEVLEFFDRIKFTCRAGDAHLPLHAAQERDSGRDSHPGGAPGLQIQ